VTWNKLNTFTWMRERVYKLDEADWDASDRVRAFELSLSTFHSLTCEPQSCRIPIGIYYLEEDAPTYEDGVPAASTPGWKHALQPRDISAIIEYMR
jgi:2-oxoglutarate/2-oxoacid ferredoxin oxidoreductase subunit beta